MNVLKVFCTEQLEQQAVVPKWKWPRRASPAAHGLGARWGLTSPRKGGQETRSLPWAGWLVAASFPSREVVVVPIGVSESTEDKEAQTLRETPGKHGLHVCTTSPNIG